MGGNRSTRRKLTTFGRVLTNSSQVRSDVRYRARTHDLSGARTSLRQHRRLSHRSPFISSSQKLMRQKKKFLRTKNVTWYKTGLMPDNESHLNPRNNRFTHALLRYKRFAHALYRVLSRGAFLIRQF